ncbi:mechanosensitive ion channel family protein [Posidoniimonas polymericola]|uniref:mechanosensitive ion channel family protein n=1 Tax=Posidoniimonas polymericola TaxID=2528002 RepID=UPI0018D2DCF3|nr:mechanosensitive ion channel family protein [Posidoniimonas polymericola]
MRRLLLVSVVVGAAPLAVAQEDASSPPADAAEAKPKSDPAETKEVSVAPTAEDDDIAERLTGILRATDWFESPEIRVEEGVAFLSGVADSEEHRAWAERLAGRTEDVVAVVNQMGVVTPSMLDFSPATSQLDGMVRSFIQATPTFLVAALLLLLTWWAAGIAARIGKHVAQSRVENVLLRGMVGRFAAVPVLLLGAYMALHVAGLTRLAATVLGGTGLLGIVVGFAFRDIAENYLASILISMRRPFEIGDLVTIGDHKGFVQTVTSRGTQIMTLEGNHVQIPNSLVYKSVIENQTANPNVRLSFTVGIDYSDSAAAAQQAVLQTLRDHDAVLADPEPLVLVDALAASTVNLAIYFWVDASHYSHIKVRSAVMRLVKRRLQQGGFTLPDESREMIFPQGVPVRLIQEEGGPGRPASATTESNAAAADQAAEPADEGEPELEATEAEGNLVSEKHEIQQQAAGARPLSDGENLIDSQPEERSERAR